MNKQGSEYIKDVRVQIADAFEHWKVEYFRGVWETRFCVPDQTVAIVHVSDVADISWAQGPPRGDAITDVVLSRVIDKDEPALDLFDEALELAAWADDPSRYFKSQTGTLEVINAQMMDVVGAYGRIADGVVAWRVRWATPIVITSSHKPPGVRDENPTEIIRDIEALPQFLT